MLDIQACDFTNLEDYPLNAGKSLDILKDNSCTAPKEVDPRNLKMKSDVKRKPVFHKMKPVGHPCKPVVPPKPNILISKLPSPVSRINKICDYKYLKSEKLNMKSPEAQYGS